MADLSVSAASKRNFVLLPSGDMIDTNRIISLSKDSIFENQSFCTAETTSINNKDSGKRKFPSEDCSFLRKELLK